MKMEIICGDKAHKFEEDCVNIFDENNKGFIVNKDGIFDKKKFNLFVAVINNKAVAYQLIYKGGDFVKQETYDKAYDDGLVFENDAIYIWDMCTSKFFENQGIQQKLINYIAEYYNKNNIYSLTDINNKNSMHLQNKLGFRSITTFVGHHNETYAVLKKDKIV